MSNLTKRQLDDYGRYLARIRKRIAVGGEDGFVFWLRGDVDHVEKMVNELKEVRGYTDGK